MENFIFCAVQEEQQVKDQQSYTPVPAAYTAQKMKFSIKDFFSKCDQIRSFLQIWSHLLKKSLMENFILCAVLSNISKWQL